MPAAPQNKKKAADLAADRLRQSILGGELVPGVALPGERELSEQLGVSRLTLRSALARLEAEGLVQPVHGSGTRVLDFRETGSMDLIGYLAAHNEGESVPIDIIRDLLEMRGLIAVEVVALAAQRATEAELEDLREHVRRMRELVDSPDEFMQADIQFARALARSAHNLAIELLANTVQRVVQSHAGLRPAFVANRVLVASGYESLLDLVATRDPDVARQGVRRLMALVDPETIRRIEELHAGGES